MAAGTCTINANQAGNSSYNPAPQVQQSFQVGKVDQTISFTSTAPANAVYGDSYTPTANGGDSGNPVTFSASGACVYDSGTGVVTMNATGICTINADQAGNDTYNAAAQVQRSFSVAKATASISLDASTLNPTYDGNPHSVTATTTPDGLSYSVSYDGNATAPTDAGSYAVVASITQIRTNTGSVSGTLTINAEADQTISFDLTGLPAKSLR